MEDTQAFIDQQVWYNAIQIMLYCRAFTCIENNNGELKFLRMATSGNGERGKDLFDDT